MRRGQLFINNEEVDVTEDISLPITYQIADVRNPEQRKGSFSKTITIPASKGNNKLFSHIYEISRETQSTLINFSPDFNVNKKASARVLIDGVEVMNGYAQLMRIEKNGSTPVSYEVVIYSTSLELFSDIGNDNLNGLDFSEFDHVLNYDNIVLSQRGGIYVNGVYKYNEAGAGGTVTGVTFTPNGYGYVYPNIDYKQSTNYRWVATRMYPAIYVKNYIDKIFETYGYTYSSSLFDSAFFKHLIIPCNLPYVQNINDIVTNSNVYFENSQSTATVFNMAGTSGITTLLDGGVGTFKLKDAVTDNVNMFVPDGGYFKSKYNTYIHLFAELVCRVFNYVDDSDVGVNVTGTNSADLQIGIYVKRVADGTIETLFTTPSTGYTPYSGTTNGASSPNYQANYTFQFNGLLDLAEPTYLYAGDIVFLGITFDASGVMTRDDNGDNVNNYIGIEFENLAQNLSGTLQYLSADYQSYINTDYSQTLLLNNYIPNYPIKDFLNDLIKCFNLQIEPDKTNPKLLTIEPYSDFYTGSTVRDWTTKVDTSKPITVLPMGELDAKSYKWSFSEDKDVINEAYQNAYKDTYGSYETIVDNDFIKEEKEVKVTLAPSPVYKDNRDGYLPVTVLGHTYPDRIETKPRILYYTWFYGITNLEYILYAGSTQIINTNVNAGLENIYGQALEVDSITAPTFALRFSVVPKVLYYSTSTMTNANFYTRYWKKYIQEITDRDSKIVDLYMRLQATDIQKFSFRDTIFIDGNYYIVNKISEYNPLLSETTRVELLKLKIYAPSIEGSQDITPSVMTFNLVEGGQDEVRDLGATSYYNLIEGGQDEVRDIGATSIVGIINGGQNLV